MTVMDPQCLPVCSIPVCVAVYPSSLTRQQTLTFSPSTLSKLSSLPLLLLPCALKVTWVWMCVCVCVHMAAYESVGLKKMKTDCADVLRGSSFTLELKVFSQLFNETAGLKTSPCVLHYVILSPRNKISLTCRRCCFSRLSLPCISSMTPYCSVVAAPLQLLNNAHRWHTLDPQPRARPLTHGWQMPSVRMRDIIWYLWASYTTNMWRPRCRSSVLSQAKDKNDITVPNGIIQVC